MSFDKSENFLRKNILSTPAHVSTILAERMLQGHTIYLCCLVEVEIGLLMLGGVLPCYVVLF